MFVCHDLEYVSHQPKYFYVVSVSCLMNLQLLKNSWSALFSLSPNASCLPVLTEHMSSCLLEQCVTISCIRKLEIQSVWNGGSCVHNSDYGMYFLWSTAAPFPTWTEAMAGYNGISLTMMFRTDAEVAVSRKPQLKGWYCWNEFKQQFAAWGPFYRQVFWEIVMQAWDWIQNK